MVARYFAYGSNMNPARVRERGISFHHACSASLGGFQLAFDKASRQHQGVGHANIVFAPGTWVEGVLYWLDSETEIGKMDRFESTPVNYSREVIQVDVQLDRLPDVQLDRLPDVHRLPETVDLAGRQWPASTIPVTSWTYFANPAVRRVGLIPPRSYLNHLLEGREYLSGSYRQMLENWPCDEQK